MESEGGAMMAVTDKEKEVLKYLHGHRHQATVTELARALQVSTFEVIKLMDSLKAKGYSLRGKRKDGGNRSIEYIELSVLVDDHCEFLEVIK
jgi:DNA-binding IclR family transcriptional regulator